MTNFERLHNVSPIDGRYRTYLVGLENHASEHALIRYRTQVEIEWFLLLAETPEFSALSPLENDTSASCRKIYQEFTSEDSLRIAAIEAETNHDVKAVEYFIKERFTSLGIEEHAEMLHFGCTSEDINNLAYGLMMNDIRSAYLLPSMHSLLELLRELGNKWIDVPMLSRTHGQAASPTTVGKEIANFVTRLAMWRNEFASVEITGKMNGAVGNFNAHVISCPEVPWQRLSHDFVSRLGLVPNLMTTQIEPHDSIAQYLNAVTGFNQVLLDLDRDCWSYISIGYFKQRQSTGEIGSSTMPHKVNPIDFENSEGNIGIAQALARHLSEKLQVSRWQRDLSDSTVLRNIGVAVAHTLIAIASAKRGLKKIELDFSRLETDLNESWEILGEAIQTVMRLHGLPNPYERVKELTRGQHFDQSLYLKLLDQLDLPNSVRNQLRELTPSKYVGLASVLAAEALK